MKNNMMNNMKNRKWLQQGLLSTILLLLLVYGNAQNKTYIYANTGKNESEILGIEAEHTSINLSIIASLDAEVVEKDGKESADVGKEDIRGEDISKELNSVEIGQVDNNKEDNNKEDTVLDDINKGVVEKEGIKDETNTEDINNVDNGEEGIEKEEAEKEESVKEDTEKEAAEKEAAEQEQYRILFIEQFNSNRSLRKRIGTDQNTVAKLQKQINQQERTAKINPLTAYELPEAIVKNFEDTVGVKEYKKAYDLLITENAALTKQSTQLIKLVAKMKLRVNELKAIIKEQERIAKLPPTLRSMEAYDYIANSVTGLSNKKISLSTLNKQLKPYGKLISQGMPYDEYKETLGYLWTDQTDYRNKPVKINVNLNKTIDYETYVNILKKLSRYEGVYIYKIGTSGEGRNLYGVEIDFPSNQKKDTIMLTGQIHAREFAGGSYILKELVDLVQKAQIDSSTRKLLETVKYVAVPIINVDGRENLIKATSDWTVRGQLWKAYASGTDGNRNFPGVAWGEVAKGNRVNSVIASSKGHANYPGPYGGSSSETKAMMKWLYHYIVVEKADVLLDYHQQGSIVYTDKPWLTKVQSKSNKNFRSNLLSFMNKGNWNRRYGAVDEKSTYNLDGVGSTVTDYAMGLATGAKFSPAYGFHVYSDGKKEYSLMEIRDLDRVKFNRNAPNDRFKSLTLEIGYGSKYLGNSQSTRKLLAKEYTNYHFDQLLEYLAKIIQ